MTSGSSTVVQKKRGRPPKNHSQDAKDRKEKTSKRKMRDIDNVDGDEDNGTESDEEVYEVESIKGMRIDASGEPEYLIKWVGFTAAFNTWQKLEDLNCPELLANFKIALANDPSLDLTDASITFPPPVSKDSWESLVTAIDGLRETKDETGTSQIVARIFWKCGFETEELLDHCIEAVPRQLLKFLLSKLKFKSE